MNTEEKAIIFDKNCPMCALYTQGFVSAGMLKPENRVPFTCLPEAYQGQIDIDRSRHEIALVDVQGGKTLYGLDSLLYLIGTRLPTLARIGRWKPLYIFFSWLYAFVSYNRRVIIQAPKTTGLDCAPDFHAGYRGAFIGFVILLTLFFLKIDFQIIACVVFGHYLLPFLPKHARTELLGQLAVSILIGMICGAFLPILGILLGSLSYALRLRFWLRNWL